MTLNEVIIDWESKKRYRGCVSAANWFCKRVPSFYPKRVVRYTSNGEMYEHVVATDGLVVIDLAPYSDGPREE